MVEPMEVDQNGESGQVTPSESVADSSKRDETPESTEVPHTLLLLHPRATLMTRMDLYMWFAFVRNTGTDSR